MADNDVEQVEGEETNGAPRTAKKVTGLSKDATLKVLVESNPKRPGGASYDRFEGYFGEGITTVQDALDAGLTMGDIKYDIVHGFIEVEGVDVEEYTVTARGPRAKKEGDPDLESETGEGLLESEDDDNPLFS